MARFLTVLCTLAASFWVVQYGPSLAFPADNLQTFRTWLSGTLAQPEPVAPPAVRETGPKQEREQAPRPDEAVLEPAAMSQGDEAETAGSDADNSVRIPYFERNTEPAAPPRAQPAPAQTGPRGSVITEPGDPDLQVPQIPLPERPQPTAVPTPMPRAPAPQPAEELIVQPGKGVQTLLLLGSDKRTGDSTWRTDVIMVVVVDYADKAVKIISIPRDLYIETPPEVEPNKINTFDYWGEQLRPGGGPELLSQIIHDYMGIPIELYARLQFSGFIDVVDALGGIEVHVPCAVYDMKPQEDIYLNLQPGDYKMDGATALAYVRTREQGGDLARVQRQQHVLMALRNKFKVRNLAPQIPGLYNTLKNAVDTNIGFIDAVNLARFGYYLKFENIDMLTLSPPAHMENGWASGMQVWLPDWMQIRQDVQHMIHSPLNTQAVDADNAAVAVESRNLNWSGCG